MHRRIELRGEMMSAPAESYWKRVPVKLKMPTRTIIVDGALTVTYAAGRDEDYVDAFLDQLRNIGISVTKGETSDEAS